MRKPLRHAIATIESAGFRVLEVRNAGRHTEILVQGGRMARLHMGNNVSHAFERGLRSTIRKWKEAAP